MVRVAIVEDTESDVALVKSHLSRYQTETGCELQTQMFSDGETFLEHYGNGFDIVLMDIEMPGCDGMEIAARLRERDEEVCLLFVTRLANYAIRGYNVRAFDFLVKPLEYENFAIRFGRAVAACQRSPKHEIVVMIPTGAKRLRLSDLYYIEVMNHTLLYHTTGGDFTVRGSIRECEEQLGRYDFIRCNNSFLVNLRHVSELKGNEILVGGKALPIGRTKRKEFLQRLTQFFGDSML